MRVPLVYLAGPIDAVSKEEADDWRCDAAKRLASHGLVSFMPQRAFVLPVSPGTKAASAVRAANRAVIDRCAAMLAHVPEATLCLGTIREVEYARAQEKAVIVFGAPALRSSLEAHDVVLSPDLGEACEDLVLWLRDGRAP